MKLALAKSEIGQIRNKINNYGYFT